MQKQIEASHIDAFYFATRKECGIIENESRDVMNEYLEDKKITNKFYFVEWRNL